ncbi:MAG: SpvB/TcaC N-terminal domain-containing protein, partial [Myxococcota bacterium]
MKKIDNNDPFKVVRIWAVTTALLSLSLPAYAQLGVSDDRVSLPAGPGSLEGVGENVGISENMGIMQYSVPIVVPPGFAGVTPELAFAYSSGNGSSLLGIGWDLMIPTMLES